MNAGPDTTDVAAHAVGIGAADEPKGQAMTLIERLEKAGEGSREFPFVVTVIARRGHKFGYRCGFVWAANDDEAIGRFVRFAEADNPGWTISTPAVLHITDENLERARQRHSATQEQPDV